MKNTSSIILLWHHMMINETLHQMQGWRMHPWLISIFFHGNIIWHIAPQRQKDTSKSCVFFSFVDRVAWTLMQWWTFHMVGHDECGNFDLYSLQCLLMISDHSPTLLPQVWSYIQNKHQEYQQRPTIPCPELSLQQEKMPLLGCNTELYTPVARPGK